MSQSKPSVRLVVFDWGGVILRHCRSWREACGVIGLEVRPGHDRSELVEQRRAITARFQRGAVAPSAVFHQLSHATDHLYTPAECDRLHHAWLLTEYAGVAPLLARLSDTPGLTTALLSNTNELHWQRGQRHADYPAIQHLHRRYASHLWGISKPDPSIFRRLEVETGFSGPQILFFDDLAENCSAAAALGWQTALIDHTTETAPQIRDHLATIAHTHL